MIRYRMVDDPDNPGKKVKEIIHNDLVELDDLIAEIPGGFALKDKYKKIISDFFLTAYQIAKREGKTVSTPIIHIEPTGKIDKNGEYEIVVSPGEELQNAMNRVKMVQVEEIPEPDPVKINFVHDLLSDTTNKYLTPGGIIEINGKFLKLRPLTNEAGPENLSFHILKTGKNYKFTNILTNTVHKLVAEIPKDLPEEEGHLVIITGMFNDSKKMRPARKGKKLTVKRF